jgi:hypothetical protein
VKKPGRWSRYAMLKRSYRGSRKGRKPLYLYVFPADRERGWLCDGNGHWGKEINRKLAQSREFAAPE